MHTLLEDICTTLDTIAATILSQWSTDSTYCQNFGWNCVSLTRHDLAELASSLSNEIREADIDDINEDILEKINSFPSSLASLLANTIPQLPSANCGYAGPAYIGTLQNMRVVLEPLISSTEPSWEVLIETKAMPSQLAKRLRSILADLEEISPNKDELAAQIKLIKDAHDTAESLPIDMKALSEARAKVDKYATDAGITIGKIDDKHKEVLHLAEEILLKNGEAAELVSNCEEAYQITTTKGLAAAFDQRANTLANSMWAWVLGLLVALILGASVGSHRIDQLNTALSNPNAQAGLIWIQVILSLLSVGAPVWFAWLATKQIGHRFKLAEDYAFKASVAKAYEGYRKQAIKIDPAFEAQLFSSALNRLEEAPLRFVENETHGSPWHEVFFSKFGRKKDEKNSQATNEKPDS